jgi:hypothetical protein
MSEIAVAGIIYFWGAVISMGIAVLIWFIDHLVRGREEYPEPED